MGNIHFWFWVQVNSDSFVGPVFIVDWGCDIVLLSVDCLNSGLDFAIVLLFLSSKAIEQIIFIFLSIWSYIECLCSQVLSSQLEGSFNQNFLHAAILWLSLDVRSWNIQSFLGVKFGLRSINDATFLPGLIDIDNSFWLALQKTSGSFVGLSSYRSLRWGAMGDSKLY